jgi:hypothetical protein
MEKLRRRGKRLFNLIGGEAAWHIITEAKRYYLGPGGVYTVLTYLTGLVSGTYVAFQAWIDSQPDYIIATFFLGCFVLVVTLLNGIYALWIKWRREHSPISEQVIEGLIALKNNMLVVPIRIIATPKYQTFADRLAATFSVAGYRVLLNAEKTHSITPARIAHNAILVRYQKKATDCRHNFACERIVSALSTLLPSYKLDLFPHSGDDKIQLFPDPDMSDEDIIQHKNHLQIELGGEP